jgi:hypothetical protein
VSPEYAPPANVPTFPPATISLLFDRSSVPVSPMVSAFTLLVAADVPSGAMVT